MPDMVATKNFSYRTRRLMAGDTIPDVSERDAKILRAIGKADFVRTSGEIAAPPPHLKRRLAQLDHDGNGKPGGATGAADHMRALRAEYQRVVGKRAFSGWDEATLREKIAEANKC